MWLHCILSFGFNEKATAAAQCKHGRLQTLHIPDQDSKVVCFVPLGRTAIFTKELPAENIQQSIMLVSRGRVPARTLTGRDATGLEAWDAGKDMLDRLAGEVFPNFAPTGQSKQ